MHESASNSKVRSIIKKFFGFSIGSWVNMILGFVTVPIVTRLIMPEENGRVTMFNTVGGIALILFTVGLDQAFIRFYHEEPNKAALLRKTLLPSLLIGAGLSVVFLLFQKPVTFILYDASSIKLAVITVIYAFTQLFNRYVMLTLRMEQLGGMYSAVQIINRVANFLLLLLFVLIVGPHAEAIMLSTIASLALTIIIGVKYQADLWKRLFKAGECSGVDNRQIWRYAAPLMISTATMSLLSNLDIILLKSLSNTKDLGIYSSAYKIVTLLNVVQASFSTFWVPLAYSHYHEQPESRNFFSVIHDLIAVIFFALAVLVIGFKDIIGYLLGPEYREAVYIMPALVFFPVFYTLSEISGMGIYFKKKSSYQIVCSIGAILVLAVGSYFLIPPLGSQGVALSLALSYITFYALRSLIGRKCYNMNINFYKVALMTVVLLAYAVWSTLTPFHPLQIGLGAFALGLLVLLYYKPCKSAFKLLLRQR